MGINIHGGIMPKDSGWVVNDDEFKLLSELVLDMEEPIQDNEQLEFDISGRHGKDRLLFQLELANDLQIVADYGNHRLVFPAQIKKGDFANFSIGIESPKIFEKGGHLRSWRLPVEQAICLVNQQGEILHYQVKDLSTSGISLLIDDEQGSFPAYLNNIYLQLPNGERLAISATQTRRIDNKTVAYSLIGAIDDSVLASLAEYLFECHAEQYPEFHNNHSALAFV